MAIRSHIVGVVSIGNAIGTTALLCGGASAAGVDIAARDLSDALAACINLTGAQLIYRSDDVKGMKSSAVVHAATPVEALDQMLKGTGLTAYHDESGAFVIIKQAGVSQTQTVDPGDLGPANKSRGDAVETIVVTGVRASVATAREIKRSASQFLDSIVSEDIGKLPDNTIIDAIEHLTGVQVQHTSGAGETDTFLIHGLPDVATTINGREIFTTINRYFSLVDMPSELLSRVDISKSSEASDPDGGIAGLINAVLHKPFDFEGPEVGGGLYAVFSSQSHHLDEQGSVLLSDRSNTKIGEMGLLVDISYTKRHYLDFDAFNYWFGGTSNLGSVAAHTPETMGAIEYPGSRERIGVDGVFQWRPTGEIEMNAEFFYSRMRSATEANYLVTFPGKETDISALTTVTDPAGLVVMKTETATSPSEMTESRDFHNKTDTYQLSAGFKWETGPATVSAELDYTNSRYSSIGFWFDQFYDALYDFDTNYRGNGTPNVEVAAANTYDYLNPSDYHIVQFWDSWTRQSGDAVNLKLDARFRSGLPFVRSIDVGILYSDRFGRSRGGQLQVSCLTPVNGIDPLSLNYAELVDAARSPACGYVNDDLSAWSNVSADAFMPGAMVRSSGRFLDGAVDWGAKDWMVVGSAYAFTNIAAIRSAFGQNIDGPAEDPSRHFDSRERTLAGYVKLDFEYSAGAMPLTGNIGVRAVDTRRTSRANILTISNSGSARAMVYTPWSNQTDTIDWMPSFNLRLGLTRGLVARLALNRTVSRPTFSQLNPTLSLYSGATFVALGSGGNPKLGSVKSNNADAGIEYYFGTNNSIAATAFYRQIIGYVQSTTSPEDVGGIVYTVTRPANGGQGYLDGAELAYTQFYGSLPGLWSGLGLQLNGTFIQGRTRINARSSATSAYTNVSKYSYNLIGIYEYEPVSLRLAYNWRSSFLVDTTLKDAASVQPSSAFAQPYGSLDLSASYRLDGSGLTLTVNATNLTHEVYRDTFGKGPYAKIYPRDTRAFDRTLAIGLRYRM